LISKARASFPRASCTARFVFEELLSGGVYTAETNGVPEIALGNVRVILFDAVTDTEVATTGSMPK
jgi:hypothetical protein